MDRGILGVTECSSRCLQSLQVLDLSNNRLTQLEDAPFSALPRLSVLDLSHNVELRLEPRSRTFQNMQESLLDLRLSNLTLHQAPELPLPALQALCLSHNLLVQLPAEMANSLSSLRRLDLSFNGLPQVGRKSAASRTKRQVRCSFGHT